MAKTIIEVLSSCVLEKGNDHCHLHTGFVIGIIFLPLIYSIESTAVIPVNLNIGYESTVLSRRDGAIMRKNHVNKEEQMYLVEDIRQSRATLERLTLLRRLKL
jgi:hypothetical protein